MKSRFCRNKRLRLCLWQKLFHFLGQNFNGKPAITEKLYYLSCPNIQNVQLYIPAKNGCEVHYSGWANSSVRDDEGLAYLVDRRGAGVTMAEQVAVLYEGRKYNRSVQNQLRVHISCLLKTLQEIGASEMILKKRNFVAVDVSRFDCDYYRFLNGDVSAMNTFTGEYMANYSWAEFTTGQAFLNKQQLK